MKPFSIEPPSLMPFRWKEWLREPLRVRTVEMDPDGDIRIPEWTSFVRDCAVIKWHGFKPMVYTPDDFHLLRMA